MQAEAYEDATGSTPEEAAEEFSTGMDQWLENLLDEATEVGTNALNDFLRAFSRHEI